MEGILGALRTPAQSAHRALDQDHDGGISDDFFGSAARIYGTAAGSVLGAGLGAFSGNPLAVAAAGTTGAAIGNGIGQFGAPLAEEAGDFIDDAFGLRSPAPYGADNSSDPAYDGTARERGLGEQVNQQARELLNM